MMLQGAAGDARREAREMFVAKERGKKEITLLFFEEKKNEQKKKQFFELSSLLWARDAAL